MLDTFCKACRGSCEIRQQYQSLSDTIFGKIEYPVVDSTLRLKVGRQVVVGVTEPHRAIGPNLATAKFLA